MDRQGRPQPGKDRAYGRKHKYDGDGLEIQTTSLDEQGHNMNDTAGNATMVYTYHSGNLVSAKALDKDGKPVLLEKERWSEEKFGYDENGRVNSEEFFDLSGQRSVNMDGVHLIRTDHDEKGYVKEIRYYDSEEIRMKVTLYNGQSMTSGANRKKSPISERMESRLSIRTKATRLDASGMTIKAGLPDWRCWGLTTI